MPIRFQADADFNQIIVSAVLRRYPEIDFRTATAAGLAGRKDCLQLGAQNGVRITRTLDVSSSCRTALLHFRSRSQIRKRDPSSTPSASVRWRPV